MGHSYHKIVPYLNTLVGGSIITLNREIRIFFFITATEKFVGHSYHKIVPYLNTLVGGSIITLTATTNQPFADYDITATTKDFFYFLYFQKMRKINRLASHKKFAVCTF